MRIEAIQVYVDNGGNYAVLEIFEVSEEDGYLKRKTISFIVIKLPECDFICRADDVKDAKCIIDEYKKEEKLSSSRLRL